MQSRTVRLLHDMPFLLNLLQGMKWFLLANEEVPSMIMAITGRRGRPPNPDKEPRSRGRRVRGAQGRRPGRPPKAKMEDLLSKVDARLLKRLEAKGESEYSQLENLLVFPTGFCEIVVGVPQSLLSTPPPLYIVKVKFINLESSLESSKSRAPNHILCIDFKL